nr:MAG TPA: hypothetical protein [Caudoviricetes sp.]
MDRVAPEKQVPACLPYFTREFLLGGKNNGC